MGNNGQGNVIQAVGGSYQVVVDNNPWGGERTTRAEEGSLGMSENMASQDLITCG